MDTSHHHDTSGAGQGSGARRSPWSAVIVMLLLIGGFYLLREHWGHVAGLWPYLLLLGCPLMHLFGHGGHGHHHGGSNTRNGSSPDGKW
jgi:hypothetical protein